VVTLTYGDRAAASRAAARVRAIHEHVRGTDTVTGKPYAASDPALLLWVHVALVDSVLAAARAFGTPPAEADADAYVHEMAVSAELLGVPRPMIPVSAAAVTEYLEQVRPELQATPAAKESMGYMLDPAGMGEEIAELWQDLQDAALATLPGWARDMYGYREPAPVTPQRRTEIRQTLGVFDAVFMAEPGVLEARQQIELRTRQARSGARS
jgi:uncharacterized protein (DUF2236 family)